MAPTPKVHVAPPPVPDASVSPTEDSDGLWSFEIGEVLDLGAQGRFTVKDRLGRGGMGEVYRAEYVAPLMEEPFQSFALKVLRPDAYPHEQRSFLDEVRLLSLLRHESIARYHTFFVHEGRQILVMEYVEGRSLHSILRLAWRKGRFPAESFSLELVAQVAKALDYAHQAKDEQGHPLHIVHRDISPANILVTWAGLVKVVDFGIAKSDLDGRTQTLTGAGLIRGKVPYLSPEQVGRRPLDGRADLFSLACVLVEMLTGDPPFGRAWHEVTLRAIAQVTPQDVDRATRGLSRKVRAVCQKALARDPAQRFATGHEMAEALLAQHECRGLSAMREEIAALEALPDMNEEDVEKQVAGFGRARRRRRALVALGGLAVTAVFAWSVVRGVSRSTLPAPAAAPPVAAAPLEQLITPVPAQGHEVVVTPPSDTAPGEHSALPPIVATEKACIPSAVTMPPTERRGDGAGSLSNDSDKSMGPLRELVTAKSSFEVMAAKDVKASGEALSPQHAWATLFATGNARLTDFWQASRHWHTVNGVEVVSTVFMNRASGTVAVVVDLPNPSEAPPWEPLEGRIIADGRSPSESPVALRAMPRVIPPGQRGRVALVFSRSVFEDKARVEILRDSRPDFGIEVTSQELEQPNSLWRSLWPSAGR